MVALREWSPPWSVREHAGVATVGLISEKIAVARGPDRVELSGDSIR